jgi:uncharacterized protein (DUF427 family)
VRVLFNGVTLVDTWRAIRVLETSHPPSFYIPPGDIQLQYFSRTARSSFCEWKGRAAYYTITVGDRQAEDAAWFYPKPSAGFAAIAGYVAFYPSRMDACYVDDTLVTAQAGDFYGGWITPEIVGPFKGSAGTLGW